MAQKDTATLSSTINTVLADNTTGAITEAVMRSILEDVRDSFFNIADNPTKGLSTEDYTSTEKSKLAGIATAATANATDAQLRDRSTHTGEQATSTITGLDAQLKDAEYACRLSANATTVVELSGNFAGTMTWSHTSTGRYELVSGDSIFTTDKTNVIFTASDICFYKVTVMSDSTIELRVYDNSGTLADNLLNNAFFKVEVFK